MGFGSPTTGGLWEWNFSGVYKFNKIEKYKEVNGLCGQCERRNLGVWRTQTREEHRTCSRSRDTRVGGRIWTDGKRSDLNPEITAEYEAMTFKIPPEQRTEDGIQ
jgi:hypothetical protein